MMIETDRLRLAHLTTGDDDAAFMLDLLNQPSYHRFIGDRGVRTLDQARGYITRVMLDSYASNGFGLYLVTDKQGGQRLGVCGLVRRDGLEDVDIGFAFLPRYWSQGYAGEAARAVLAHARRDLGLERIVAIVSPDNEASIRLLTRLGMRYERMVRLRADDIELKLFATQRDAPP